MQVIMAVWRVSNELVFHLCMHGKAIILVVQYPAAGVPDGFGVDVAKRAGDRVVRPENGEVSRFEQRKVKGWKWTCMPKEIKKCTWGLCRRCRSGGGGRWHRGWQWRSHAKLKALVKLELKGWAGRWAEHKKRARLVRKNHPKSASCHVGYVMRVGRYLKGWEESLALQNDLHRRLDMAA